MVSLVVQPPRARQQDGLDVRQVEGSEGISDGALPPQRRVPEQEPRALAGLLHRLSATEASFARTSGKSAVIWGPICGPSVSASGPVISIRSTIRERPS